MAKTNSIQVEFRTVAKFLAKGIPVEGEDFRTVVEETLLAIKKLTPELKTAMKAAYVFASKVPREEREDFFQELILALLQRSTKDEKLAYAIARFDWIDWWRKFTVKRHFFAGSLQDTVEDESGSEVMLAELIVGECEFERKLDGDLDGKALWARLPKPIQALVQKRLLGRALNSTERSQLRRFAKANPMLLTS